MEFLLDSVILIDYLNDVDEAVEYLPQVEDTVSISVVTRAEVLTGFDAPSRALAVEFLDNFPLLEITKSIADLAADLRREQGWKLPDAFQAALAAHHDLKLVTRNTRDFSPQRHGFVVVPYTLGTEG